MPEENSTTAEYGKGVYGLSDYGVIVYPIIIPDKEAIYGIGVYGRTGYGLADIFVLSDPRNCLFSLQSWGKVEKTTSGFKGVYQRQRTSKGTIVRRLKLYRPTNPQTEAQQANRQKITNAVLAWQNLTDEQKIPYNERAIGKPFTGYNIFIKEHLLSN